MGFLEREVSDLKFIGLALFVGFAMLIYAIAPQQGWGFLLLMLIGFIIAAQKPNKTETKQRRRK